jgi:hypothetical protein
MISKWAISPNLSGLIIIVAFVQSYFTFKWGTKFMLSMVIGEYSKYVPPYT